MLPKKHRIKLVQFNQNPQKNRSFSTYSLSIKTKKNINNRNSHFVVIVTKNLDKRSSKRHLTKRMIEEVIRAKLINIKNPLDILVKAKKTFKKEDKIILEKEVNDLFKKAEIL